MTAILDTREISAQTLVLAGKKAEKSEEEWVAFDMIAPSDAPVNTKRPTEEQKQTGAQKFRQATEKRLAKVNSFFGEEAGNALENSKGNHQENSKISRCRNTKCTLEKGASGSVEPERFQRL